LKVLKKKSVSFRLRTERGAIVMPNVLRMRSATILDVHRSLGYGVVFFHSKAPAPFEDNEGYPISASRSGSVTAHRLLFGIIV